MSDEPKENKCKMLDFYCHLDSSDCVYRDCDSISNYDCKHRDSTKYGIVYCHSKLAQVNRMVLLLKDAGFDVSRKGKDDNE